MLNHDVRSIPWLAPLVGALASAMLLGVSTAHAEGVEEAAPEAPQNSPYIAHAEGVEEAVPEAPQNSPYTAHGHPTWVADVREQPDYDPWESINDKIFWFNHDVADRYALKPAATAWSKAAPEPVRQGLANAFNNVAMPKRLVNNLLQGRIPGAARELGRFVLNSTFGVVGLFDVSTRLGLDKSDADTGQTLGVYGVGPGPYVMVPLLRPLTVRDGVGLAVDSLLDPLSYVAPFVANVARSGVDTVNERAANLKLFNDVEESSLDLYSAVRNGYLQRRQKSIQAALEER